VRAAALLAAWAASAALAGSAEAAWQQRAPLPEPRSETVATAFGGRIVIGGGYFADGRTAARVDAYDPVRNRWKRLPDLPFGVNHAMATSYQGRLYVIGGWRSSGRATHAVFVLSHGRWRFGPPLPAVRAAGGAVVVGRTLVVAGGVGPHGLARAALAFDLERERWRFVPGPTPRQHLGVAAWNGWVYTVAGRILGQDTSMATFERWKPGRRRWATLPPVPQMRGGTAAAAVAGQIVSVGGETTTVTLAEVFAFDVASRRWRRLPDSPTPRHGLGVAALGRFVYAVGGGPVPGLSVSSRNEALRVGAP
jgi:hypothetical protein